MCVAVETEEETKSIGNYGTRMSQSQGHPSSRLSSVLLREQPPQGLASNVDSNNGFSADRLAHYEKRWPKEHAAEQTLRGLADCRSSPETSQQQNGHHRPLLPPLTSLPLRSSPSAGGGGKEDMLLPPLRTSQELLQPAVAVAPPIPFIPTSFSLKPSPSTLLGLHHSSLPSLDRASLRSASSPTYGEPTPGKRPPEKLPPFILRGGGGGPGGHDYPMYDGLMPVDWNSSSSKVIAQRERLLRTVMDASATARPAAAREGIIVGDNGVSAAAPSAKPRAAAVISTSGGGLATTTTTTAMTMEDSEEGYREGFMDGYKEGRKEGYEGTHHFKEAYRDGFREGRTGGYIDGKQEGYRGGRIDGALATSLDEEWDIDQYGNMLDSEATRGWRGQALPPLRRAKLHAGNVAAVPPPPPPAPPPAHQQHHPSRPQSAVWERVPADKGASNDRVSSVSINFDFSGPTTSQQHDHGTHRYHHHHHHSHNHSHNHRHHHYHSHNHHDHGDPHRCSRVDVEDSGEGRRRDDDTNNPCGRTGSDTHDEKDIAESFGEESRDLRRTDERDGGENKKKRKKRKREAEARRDEDPTDRFDATLRDSKKRPRSEHSAASPPDSTDSEKKRKRATREQLDILERVFEQEELPSRTRRKELANELGFSPRRIQIWFQNRRAKSKKKEGKQYVMVNYGKHSFKKEPRENAKQNGGGPGVAD